MIPTRAEIEAEVERLLTILDQMDGDPDFEGEPIEEQHDREADISWNTEVSPYWFVIAEQARKKARKLR